MEGMIQKRSKTGFISIKVHLEVLTQRNTVKKTINSQK